MVESTINEVNLLKYFFVIVGAGGKITPKTIIYLFRFYLIECTDEAAHCLWVFTRSLPSS